MKFSLQEEIQKEVFCLLPPYCKWGQRISLITLFTTALSILGLI